MYDGYQAVGATTGVVSGETTDAPTRAIDWARRRTFRYDGDVAETLIALKRESGTSISVVIPGRNVAATIADVAGRCVSLREAGAVDEVVMVDAATSSDGTDEIAAAAGATVHQENQLLPWLGPALGKGDAMWRAQSAVSGDVVVYVDGDSVAFDEAFVLGLAGPLLEDSTVQLVKGAYRRPFKTVGDSLIDGGGRVTELAARPLLNVHFPELAAVQQPLAGEFAARRTVLARMPFMTGYGAEIQLLIDFYRQFGLGAIAQGDIGERINPHQPLHDLGPMAFAVARSLLSRVEGQRGALDRDDDFLGSEHDVFLNYVNGEPTLRTVALTERPPFATVLKEGDDGA